MNYDELERLVRDEAEATKDSTDPLPDDVGARPNLSRSTVFSIRLTAEEVAAVQAAADRAELPTSTLVRSWIVQRLKGTGPAEAELRGLIRQEVRIAVQDAVRNVVQDLKAS